MDYQADYKEAQANSHHIDCDGYMTLHRVTIKCERVESIPLYTAVCEECGPLHIGSYGSEASAKSHAIGHSSEVRCDGRCRNWT